MGSERDTEGDEVVMADGSGKYFKWTAGGLAVALMTLAGFAGDQVNMKVENNTDSITVIERRMNVQEVEQSKMVLQVAGIAKAVGAPVILDTVRAGSIINGDSL